MSSASSNQSFVRDGAGYEELYPSGYKEPDELSERTPSATSPSSTNEDMELAEQMMMPKSSPVRCTILALVAVAYKREQDKNTLQEAPVWSRPNTL